MFAKSAWDELADFRRSFDQMFDNFYSVKQDDLKLSLESGHLVIQGKREAPKDFGKEGRGVQPLAYSKFERRLELPNGLEQKTLTAPRAGGKGLPVSPGLCVLLAYLRRRPR